MTIDLGALLIVLIAILLSMILHEVAHGLVAYWLGDETAKSEGRLTLNPFKHLDPILSVILPLTMALTGGPIFGGAKPVPINTYNLKGGAWGMALVAIAGPILNFVLAFICFALLVWTNAIGFGGELLLQMVYVNLGFGVFNLIPIPPLDGSRVLYAIAPDPVRNIMSKIEPFGIMIVLILVIVFPSAIYGIMNGAMQGAWALFATIFGVV